MDKTRLDLEEAVDCLKLDIQSLKMTLNELIPNFREKFRGIKNTVLREIDPQRINKA